MTAQDEIRPLMSNSAWTPTRQRAMRHAGYDPYNTALSIQRGFDKLEWNSQQSEVLRLRRPPRSEADALRYLRQAL